MHSTPEMRLKQNLILIYAACGRITGRDVPESERGPPECLWVIAAGDGTDVFGGFADQIRHIGEVCAFDAGDVAQLSVFENCSHKIGVAEVCSAEVRVFEFCGLYGRRRADLSR